MAQPPVRPIMARTLSRAMPFVCVRTFNGVLNNGTNVGAEFDTVELFADPNQFNTVSAFPSGSAATHAVGPWLDALVFCDVATTLRVEFAVDRGCSYRQPTADIAIAAGTPTNIAQLRVTGRFVRVTLFNTSGGNSTITEFGIYVRSA
jgi:hypothetical protein